MPKHDKHFFYLHCILIRLENPLRHHLNHRGTFNFGVVNSCVLETTVHQLAFYSVAQTGLPGMYLIVSLVPQTINTNVIFIDICIITTTITIIDYIIEIKLT